MKFELLPWGPFRRAILVNPRVKEIVTANETAVYENCQKTGDWTPFYDLPAGSKNAMSPGVFSLELIFSQYL